MADDLILTRSRRSFPSQDRPVPVITCGIVFMCSRLVGQRKAPGGLVNRAAGATLDLRLEIGDLLFGGVEA